MNHTEDYLAEALQIVERIDSEPIEQMAQELHALRERKGRLFLIGLGGSYANCIHMAADLRKLCRIDALTMDISEFTARANDDGWQFTFDGWLQFINAKDALMVLSVGGGAGGVSTSITQAVLTASISSMPIFGIVGPDGGTTSEYAKCVIRVPAPSHRITPHTEAFQAVVWHALVCHPLLQINKMTW